MPFDGLPQYGFCRTGDGTGELAASTLETFQNCKPQNTTATCTEASAAYADATGCSAACQRELQIGIEYCAGVGTRQCEAVTLPRCGGGAASPLSAGSSTGSTGSGALVQDVRSPWGAVQQGPASLAVSVQLA